MSIKRYVLHLCEAEREALESLCRRGRVAAQSVARARIMLAADDGDTDAEIAERVNVSLKTVERIRMRAVLEGPENALSHRPQDHPRRKILLDGQAEAHLVALACSPAPEGRARWTMKLLANKLVELGYVERISDETVRRVMKKKSAAALADGAILHSAREERGVRRRHGGRAGGVSPGLRSKASASLHG